MGSRIVLDTNILVSALGWCGAPHGAVRLCLEGHHQLLLSPDILDELERVLAYPKLEFSPSAILVMPWGVLAMGVYQQIGVDRDQEPLPSYWIS